MLKNFEPRLYQQTIFATSVKYNTLVVLPTGMGKTNISLMLAAHRLIQYPQSKVLILAPTKPLVDQHVQTIKASLAVAEEKIALFTGLISPEQRAQLWQHAQVIVSTPQGLENDLLSRRLSLADVSLLVFDEAHRAVGDYSYVWIAQQYQREAQFPKILALTASPGSDLEKINEVVRNLFIEEIEVRTDDDPDVQPYVQPVAVHWVKVELPDTFKEIQQLFKTCLKERIESIKKYTAEIGVRLMSESKTELLALQGQLQGELAQGNKDFNVMKAVSVCAEAIKIQHALELLETQGLTSLYSYLRNLHAQAQTGTVKAVKNLVQDSTFRMAYVKIQLLFEQKQEHPKLDKLKQIIEEKIPTLPDYKLIVFTQYRDSGSKIVEELTTLPSVKAQLFVGQAKKGLTGLTQKKQVELLQQFKEGAFNVLVATSVGEEGLDIPQVDLVIFYEPIPSVIRHIQRRGRTGRQEKGEVIILMAKDTRDEGYRWSAHHKERRMYAALKDIRNTVKLSVSHDDKKQTLTPFLPKDKVFVYADYREKGNAVIKELIALGAQLKLDTLSVGDYVVSPRCAIEFKSQEDFIDSLLDGRLLSQVKNLKETYERPVIIVEGAGDLYALRNVHPNALRGLLASITVSYGMPILFTKNYKDTAALIQVIAKREQDVPGEFSLHGNKKPMNIAELQEYIVSSFPGIGGSLAKPLLQKFKTIHHIVNASEEDLKQVDLIGPVKAQRIKEILMKEYLQ